MSNLSELLPAGGAAKEFEPVASGTLPNGRTVNLKANGQVELVAETSTPITQVIPEANALLSTAYSSYNTVAYDPNTQGRFVMVYQDQGSSVTRYGVALVGTISGTNITFGGSYIFSSFTSTNYIHMAFDPNVAGRFVVAYSQGTSGGYTRVGTISGSSISYGSAVQHRSGNVQENRISFDPLYTNRFVLSYGGNSSTMYVRSAIITGTSISLGGTTSHSGNAPSAIACDPNNAGKFVVIIGDYAVVGTITGTSTVSLGTTVVLNVNPVDVSVSFNPNSSGVFAASYRASSNSGYGRVRIGTVSGTTTSFGSEIVFNSGSTYYTAIAYDSKSLGKFIVAYKDSSHSSGYGNLRVGTMSGTYPSMAGEITFHAGSNTDFNSLSFDPNDNGQFVVFFRDGSNDEKPRIVLGQMGSALITTNLASTDFVGITAEAITSGSTGVVVPKGGVATNLSSLSIGSEYYVQANGTLSTASSSPAVHIGKAISATSLILKG